MKDLLAPPRPVLSWPIFSYLFCFQLKPTVSSYILETDLVHDFVYQRFYQTEAKQFSFLKRKNLSHWITEDVLARQIRTAANTVLKYCTSLFLDELDFVYGYTSK